MLRSWVSGKKAQLNGSSNDLSESKETAALQEAMAAVMHIMNDDLEAAEAGLGGGDSSFHKLGISLVNFLRAVLGFEKEVMKEAQESLWATEAQCAAEQKRVQREDGAFKSTIYDAGAEFILANSECLLMGALLGVLSENLTEAVKGFYNMRKAYMALSNIAEAEKRFLESRRASTKSASLTSVSIISTQPNSKAASLKDVQAVSEPESSQTPDVPQAASVPGADDEGDAFADAPEEHEDTVTPMEYQGKTEVNGVTKDLTTITLEDRDSARAAIASTEQQPTNTLATQEEIDDTAFVHPIDIYIHSGINLCFGLMLLMLSIIPPAFGKVLSIIGFRGDRSHGLKMLWQASKFDNINGAMAGLTLLAYYNGAVSFCDIVQENPKNLDDNTPENITGHPLRRLEALLATMRRKYPKSALWKLEESRMLSAKARTKESIQLLKNGFDSPLKQINALAVFERGLQAMNMHDYELCASSFVECTKLNNWSHSLYFFIAATARVELYRRARSAGDTKKAETEAQKAADLFAEARAHAGKRRFMARQMPFETFGMQKIAKWEQRAKEWNVPLVDATGVSPFEEMLYFWNGYKKMDRGMLQASLDALAWSENLKENPNWERVPEDDKGLLALLRAATLRSMGEYEEAKTILKTEIITKDKSLFKGTNKDDFVPPVAHYEMATNLWQERTHRGDPEEGNAENVKRIKESQEWLEVVKNWESYTLDARVGLKVSAGVETLKQWLVQHDKEVAA